MPEPVSPLIGRSADGYIQIEDTGVRGQITLRGDLGSEGIAEVVRELVGVEIPGIWQIAQNGDRKAVWMAPDELLLLLPRKEVPGAVALAGEMLAGQHHLVLDVSNARVVLRLSGAGVAEVLAKGAPGDLSEGAFPPGSARRTRLGALAVGFWRLDEQVWEIIAFRSYAHHLMTWLEDAARKGAEVHY